MSAMKYQYPGVDMQDAEGYPRQRVQGMPFNRKNSSTCEDDEFTLFKSICQILLHCYILTSSNFDKPLLVNQNDPMLNHLPIAGDACD